MAAVDLSVVIVNWNTRDDVGRCLTSLRAARGELKLEILLVDNASTDGTVALVRRRFPEVEVLALPRNRGFAGGNNVALGRAIGRHVLLLNPDTIVLGDALTRLVAYADANPGVGLLGPKLLYGDGSLQPSCRRFPSVGALLFRNTPLERLWPNNPWARRYLMEDWPHDRPREVDWLSGACLLVPRAALAVIGPLDERFFMYCEDMDWCYRAHQAGLRVVYLPQAEVIHLVGRSSDRRPLAMTRAHHVSMGRYLAKHYGPVAAALAAPLLVARFAAVWARARWSPAREM